MTAAPGESGDGVSFRDDTAGHRYEVAVGGQVVGFAVYYREADAVVFVHTEVDPEHAGQHLASRLARFALDDVRARHLRAVPLCPFFAAYIARHESYRDLVAPAHRRRTILTGEERRRRVRIAPTMSRWTPRTRTSRSAPARPTPRGFPARSRRVRS